MNLHENTDFGRKVFFLNPPYNFKNIVIPVLADMEYEIYIIDNPKKAKSILRLYPDSICFVYVDTGMSIDHWYNFVMSFDQDPVLSTIFLGVISDRSNRADREHFLLNAVIPAGFISLTTTKDDLIEIFHGILEINGAKGQRKYVRADCKKDKRVSAQCVLLDTSCFLGINNISSVGLSCSVSATLCNLFTLNLLIRDFTLHLRDKTIKCNAVVVHSSVSGNEAKVILLFTQGMPFTARVAVKAYIRDFLQTSIENIALDCEIDETDYSKKQGSATKTDDAFLIAVEDDEFSEDGILYADDLSEISFDVP